MLDYATGGLQKCENKEHRRTTKSYVGVRENGALARKRPHLTLGLTR
jgi:hypothetical protein